MVGLFVSITTVVFVPSLIHPLIFLEYVPYASHPTGLIDKEFSGIHTCSTQLWSDSVTDVYSHKGGHLDHSPMFS